MAKRRPANKGKTCTRHKSVYSPSKGKKVKVCAAFGGVSKKRRTRKSR